MIIRIGRVGYPAAPADSRRKAEGGRRKEKHKAEKARVRERLVEVFTIILV
jgi:hypothetical protein